MAGATNVGEREHRAETKEEWSLEGEAYEFHASGSATSTISAGGLSGFLDGDMKAILRNEGGRGNRVVTCTAPDHSVVFSR